MEQTLVIIKPDGVKRKLVGRILQRFEDRKLNIKQMYHGLMDKKTAIEHYDHLKEEPFFSNIIDYMISGPVVFLVLEGENAILMVRTMIGATNALHACPGTIRGDFATNASENIIHASDSPKNAKREIQRFFPTSK